MPPPSYSHTYGLSLVCCLLIVLSIGIAQRSSPMSTFTESLDIVPLNANKVLVHFDFVTRTLARPHHTSYDLFPKSVAQVIDKFGISHLRTSLTQGRWLSSFGSASSPVIDHSLASAPVGLELAVAFNSSTTSSSSSSLSTNALTPITDAEWHRWKGVTLALSGLFGASIVELDQSLTIRPSFAFPIVPPSATATNGTHDNDRSASNVWVGALPREVVCTENLTPWIRLLPCRDVVCVNAHQSLLSTHTHD
jgi:GPI-anchor transamidase subunit T